MDLGKSGPKIQGAYPGTLASYLHVYAWESNCFDLASCIEMVGM